MLTKLTLLNFDEVVKTAGLAAVLFHRPDCVPSAEMVPELERYSQTRSDMQFYVLQKPCTTPLFERFNIKGYPTIVFYRNGERLGQYDGINDTEPYEHMAKALDAVSIPVSGS